MTRTMLIPSGLPKNLWAKALNTTSYIINRCMIRPLLNKTPYELLKGRKPNIRHLRVFGGKCYVHNNWMEPLGKFYTRSDEAIFLKYSSYSKAYKVFNKRTLSVKESVHILFDETNSLVENDAQYEDFEFGLVRKNIDKAHESEPQSGADNMESGQK